MLIWLDGGDSRKARSNENFAREFLELFTLGQGHYTEADVREAARAFTGWVRGFENGDQRFPTFTREAGEFDDGPKTFLGRTGPWGSSDIVKITLERPEAAIFLARKLYRLLVSEADDPGPKLIEPLADEIRSHGYSIRHVVEVILRSRHFYSRAAYRQRIKSPVEFSAGILRMLEVPRSSVNPLALLAALEMQGQELFAPPNVKGWEGGKTWINSTTLLQRGNWAADVLWGRPENGLSPYDPLSWSARQGVAPGRAAEAFVELLLQDDLGDEARAMILQAGRDGTAGGLLKVLQRIVNCPEFQLS
jgi:uncharacterized protein (DUF1800 family)